MQTIFPELYQFSTYNQVIDLDFHQYLLLTEEPLLIHTGNVEQASFLLPKLKEILCGQLLSYIFVSHFEADECGGINLILEEFPQAKVLVSEVTARQFTGFGFSCDFLVKRAGESLAVKGGKLEFIGYPAEMHLWEGLLLFEKSRGIFFSSDLMVSPGESHGRILASNWQDELDRVGIQQIPHKIELAKLKGELVKITPTFIATGHGPCIKLK